MFLRYCNYSPAVSYTHLDVYKRQGNAEYEKKSVENRTQISLVNDLRKYLRGNEYEVLPSNVGLQDACLLYTSRCV